MVAPVFVVPRDGVIRSVGATGHSGPVDVSVADGRISSVQPAGSACGDVLWDGGGTLHPGLVDVHCHLTGGGGAAGPASRPDPVDPDQLLAAGITTAAGCIGREVGIAAGARMLTRVRALNQHGVRAAMFTGGLGPVPGSVTGDVASDAALVEHVAGVKFAVDHDSPHRDAGRLVDDLIRAVAVSRDLGRRPRFTLHVGPDPDLVDAVVEAVGRIPDAVRDLVLVTHVNWSDEHLACMAELGASGVWLDVTAAIEPGTFAGAVSPDVALGVLIDRGITRLTVSSDANGSHVTTQGGRTIVHLHPVGLLQEHYAAAARRHGTEAADRFFAVNPSLFLSLDTIVKGDPLRPGAPADLVVRDNDFAPRMALTRAGASWWAL